MMKVVCPHCDTHVSIQGNSVSHFCPYCKGEFQLENDACEFSEFERELNLTTSSSESNNKINKSKNIPKYNRKSLRRQRIVGERFKRDIDTIRLTKFSPLRLLQSIFVFFHGGYILLCQLAFGFAGMLLIIGLPFMYADLNPDDVIFLVIALPICILLSRGSLTGVKENFRTFRRVHFFLHSSSNIVELTGHRKYGLGHHEVMYRTNLTSKTIVEPFTEITRYEGESGGTSHQYGLLFEGTESSWTFYSSQREVKSVLSEIESRCNVMVLPHRGE